MELDDLDMKILEEFGKNPRASFREIGRKLKVHTATVIRRFNKLIDDGIILGTCVKINFEKLGFMSSAWLMLNVDLTKKKKILNFIKKEKRVVKAYEITGSFDIAIEVIVKDVKELKEIIEKVAGVDGVKRVESNVVLSKVKDYCLMEDGLPI